MAVKNYNTNKLVYIYESGSNHSDTSYTRIDGPLDGGFVLDSESSLNISMEFTNSYGDILDKLTAGAKASAKTAGGGLLSTVKGVGEAISGGRFKLMNTNVKTWEGTSPLTIPSTLKLKFYYGIKNEYNCKTEVWDPIKALVKKFAPFQIEEGSRFVQFGVPTLGQAMAEILFSVTDTNGIDGLFEKNQQESTSTPTETGANEKENNDTNTVKNILDSLKTNNNNGKDSQGREGVNKFMGAIEDAYAVVDSALDIVKNSSKMFQIKIGQLVFTDLYIGNVKWEFDYQQVDEFGYPYKGTVELKNISTSRYTTQQYLDKVMPK